MLDGDGLYLNVSSVPWMVYVPESPTTGVPVSEIEQVQVVDPVQAAEPVALPLPLTKVL